MFLVSSCSCLCSIHWNQVLSREWRCPTTSEWTTGLLFNLLCYLYLRLDGSSKCYSRHFTHRYHANMVIRFTATMITLQYSNRLKTKVLCTKWIYLISKIKYDYVCGIIFILFHCIEKSSVFLCVWNHKKPEDHKTHYSMLVAILPCQTTRHA